LARDIRVVLFDRVRLLGVAIAGTEDRLDDDERTLFGRLEEARGAAPAAKRGRRTEADDGHDPQ
jgi:hypothetical protein